MSYYTGCPAFGDSEINNGYLQYNDIFGENQ